MSSEFSIVTRRRSKLRMALTGVTGSGKTLGALYIAFGITNDWSKIALIDTEHERARFYAKRDDLSTGEFYYASISAPYSTQKYIEYVSKAAELVGEDGVVIIDSLSHAWNNEGGVLEVKEKIAMQPNKNSFSAWLDAGREQNKMVNNILSSDCHTIVTLRSKMEYVLQENERGRQSPVKVGLAPVQRDDLEYEFDIVLNIDRSHIATASKDVTFLDKYGAVITPELGRSLALWLNDGEEPPRCEICGKLIMPYKNKSTQEIVEGSYNLMSKLACMPCCIEYAKTTTVSE